MLGKFCVLVSSFAREGGSCGIKGLVGGMFGVSIGC